METMSFRIQLRFFLFKTHVPPFKIHRPSRDNHMETTLSRKRFLQLTDLAGGWKLDLPPEVLQIWLYPFGIHHTPFTQPSKGGIWMPGHSLTVGDPFFCLFPCDSWFELKLRNGFPSFHYLLLELAKSAPEITSKIHPTSAKWAPIIEFALEGPEFSRKISRHSGEKEVRAKFQVCFNENQLDTTVFSITFSSLVVFWKKSSLESLKEAPEDCF